MSKYLGDVSAYALAVSQGYEGTEEEYAETKAERQRIREEINRLEQELSAE